MSSTPETMQTLSRLLGTEGATVDVVTDGATAFQLVWDTDYDVIVTEVGMAGIDGRDLYMAFQNTWPELIGRMIFVCTQTTSAIDEFVGRTTVPFLRAPVAIFELREALRAARSASRARAFV